MWLDVYLSHPGLIIMEVSWLFVDAALRTWIPRLTGGLKKNQVYYIALAQFTDPPW